MNRKSGGIAAIGPAAALLALALVAVTAAAPGMPLHLELEKSSPAADEVLARSPAAVTLWFTQAPQIAGTSVRVVPRGGEPLDLGDAKAKEDDASVVVLTVSEPLADGEYQVMWRAMAQDGHTVRGDFSFTVRGSR